MRSPNKAAQKKLPSTPAAPNASAPNSSPKRPGQSRWSGACARVVRQLQSDVAERLRQIVTVRRTDSLLDGIRFEQWIKEHAHTTQKSVVSWRPPSLDVSSIVDEDYQQLLLGDVVACDAKDFKTLLKDRLAGLMTKPRGVGRNLFVHHRTQDTDSADEVGGTAEDMAAEIKVALTDERRAVAEAIGTDPVHGLMLVYGACSEDWIESSLEALKVASDAANNRHKLKPPARAIVRANSSAPPLRRRPPRWQQIDANDRAAIEQFLQKIKGEESQP